MSDQWDISDDSFSFLEDNTQEISKPKDVYKILIADDEEDVHKVTKLLLNSFVFEGKGLEFLDSYSGSETREFLKEHDDVALVFLDVVMETSSAGLDTVEYIRNVLENDIIRIILRTGQPGEAPEDSVIEKYDINDYRIKTELTVKRLKTSLFSSLRSYRDIQKLKNYQLGLEKIITSSSNLFNNNTLDDFLASILEQLNTFQSTKSDAICLKYKDIMNSNGFITINDDSSSKIVAATGTFKEYIGKNTHEISELSDINDYLQSNRDSNESERLKKIGDGFLICNQKKGVTSNFIYIQGDMEAFDFKMINLFLSNFSIALDNFMLNNIVSSTQNEFVLALADTVESHFEETGNHNRRVSNMIYNFALVNNFSYQEAEVVKLASTMHDLGKVAIPDSILKKPGKLNSDEFEIIKSHTHHGYNILNRSDLPIFNIAAEISLFHHEKYDGTGYPKQLEGKNIPLNARMMAIIDVYDALTNKRCYKDAMSREEAIKKLSDGKGSHFDPFLVELFLDNIDEILLDINM